MSDVALPGTATALYEAACRSLGEARTLIEARDVGHRAGALKEYARLMRDRRLELDAAELRIRAERRLGQMLAQVPLHRGGSAPVRDDLAGSDSEPVRLAELGIDKKLSARAQKVASLSERAMAARLDAWRASHEHGNGRISADVLRGGAIAGARSIMASRAEPDDSLDYFPTPPWATRALMQHVLPQVVHWNPAWRVLEPACGEGHIAAVLREYGTYVRAADIHDYGTCHQDSVADFLGTDNVSKWDWIITNPPFRDRALPFVERALAHASRGVAMFMRSQWVVEGITRYEALLRDRPPTLCAFFVERVPLHKGRWEPDGDTATAYCWLVWVTDMRPRPPFWIPPECRNGLSRDSDRKNFAAWSMAGDDA